ncbi:hypothetical protein ANN_27284 [Periplaneta americana]|uniref:Uncharacterized protein n=1 Tax=Periplaneta americana TaxID=6978 RepID=A0ABQ8RXW0_PERAM|nr:hypothetical protein ANN_27284 [Periplaneta americana]
MAGLCEGGNEPPGSLKANKQCYVTSGHVADLHKVWQAGNWGYLRLGAAFLERNIGVLCYVSGFLPM